MTYRFPAELAGCDGFQWDAGNSTKNEKHGVSSGESEQAFSNRPIILAPAKPGPAGEVRRALFGQSDAGRRLMVVFTVRGTLVRVISARSMTRQMRRIYDQE